MRSSSRRAQSPLAPSIEGLDFALPLRTAADASRLRAKIDIASGVVIVGGGATGVQLAGAVAAKHRSVAVTLMDGAQTLLAGLGAATGGDAARILGDRGVDVRLGSDVDEIGEGSVNVAGDMFEGLPVWAAGVHRSRRRLRVSRRAIGPHRRGPVPSCARLESNVRCGRRCGAPRCAGS